MKKFELIVGLIAIIGIVLKIFRIPGSDVLTLLSLSTLSMFYYVFSFALFNNIRLRDIFNKVSYKDTNANRIFAAIIFGFALSLITIGGLFKLQFWPGASIQLLTGLIISGLILLILTFFYIRFKGSYYTKIFKRIAIYGGFGLILYLTPTATLIDIYYGDNPDYAELYKNVLAEPENIELREQLEQMREKMP